MNRKAVELIKDLYPWAKVARMDFHPQNKQRREIYLFEVEPNQRHSSAYVGTVYWSHYSQDRPLNLIELEPFSFWGPLLDAVEADPSTWVIRFDEVSE